MWCVHAPLLALLAVLVVLSWSTEAVSAAVPGRAGGTGGPKAPLRRVFMTEADASNFFRRRSRRGAKSQDEINAEQRLVLAADERRREFHEEKRNEYESDAEEEPDEQDEGGREVGEQWREFHHDGIHPPFDYDHHSTGDTRREKRH